MVVDSSDGYMWLKTNMTILHRQHDNIESTLLRKLQTSVDRSLGTIYVIFFPQMYFYTTTKINLNVLNIQYTCQQCLAIIYDISYIILMTRYACLNGFMGTLKFGYLEW